MEDENKEMAEDEAQEAETDADETKEEE